MILSKSLYFSGPKLFIFPSYMQIQFYFLTCDFVFRCIPFPRALPYWHSLSVSRVTAGTLQRVNPLLSVELHRIGLLGQKV